MIPTTASMTATVLEENPTINLYRKFTRREPEVSTILTPRNKRHVPQVFPCETSALQLEVKLFLQGFLFSHKLLQIYNKLHSNFSPITSHVNISAERNITWNHPFHSFF